MARDTGSNSASNDSISDWTRQYRQQRRVCDEENGVLRSLLKRAKADGVNTKSMIAAVAASKLGAEEVTINLRDQLRYMAIIHVPMTQESLFDWDDELNSATRHDDEMFTADESGYKVGRQGGKVEECLYDPVSENHGAWMKGWHRGQEAIARELGPNVTQANASRARPERNGTQPTLAVSNGKAVKPKRSRAKPVSPPRKRGSRSPSLPH